jgi:hypothetical protein
MKRVENGSRMEQNGEQDGEQQNGEESGAGEQSRIESSEYA